MGRNSYSESAGIASFPVKILAEAISMTHSGMFHQYFYILFLWANTVSDFRPLEVYKNLVLPLSTIALTVNSHADNHLHFCSPYIIILKEICFKGTNFLKTY